MSVRTLPYSCVQGNFDYGKNFDRRINRKYDIYIRKRPGSTGFFFSTTPSFKKGLLGGASWSSPPKELALTDATQKLPIFAFAVEATAYGVDVCLRSNDCVCFFVCSSILLLASVTGTFQRCELSALSEPHRLASAQSSLGSRK